jgi:glutathione S-transferase
LAGFAAEVKGIPYEGKLLEASKGELKTPEFLAINPLGRVPAIRDGNFTLHESLAIMVYLDRKHPNPPLFGRTAEEAGQIFERISEFISDFWPPGQRLIRSIFFGQPLAADEAKRRAREDPRQFCPVGGNTPKVAFEWRAPISQPPTSSPIQA